MLNQKTKIYAIPGWGFQSSVFNRLNNEDFHIVGLDYIHLSQFSLIEIAQRLSTSLAEQSIVLGWSFGGLIAIKLAALFPHKVSKLILLASQPKLRSTTHWIGIDRDDAHDFKIALMDKFNQQMDYFFRLIYYPSLPSSVARKTIKKFLLLDKKQELISLLSLLFHADLRAEYCHLNINIHHIICEQDAVIPQSSAQLKALNSNISITILEKQGHAGFLIDHTAYIDTIESFLNDA